MHLRGNAVFLILVYCLMAMAVTTGARAGTFTNPINGQQG